MKKYNGKMDNRTRGKEDKRKKMRKLINIYIFLIKTIILA